MEDDRERRMKALRERVKAKKAEGALIKQDEELVVDQAVYEETVVVTEQEPEQDWFAMADRDADRWRNLAASLIMIGSILGMAEWSLNSPR